MFREKMLFRLQKDFATNSDKSKIVNHNVLNTFFWSILKVVSRMLTKQNLLSYFLHKTWGSKWQNQKSLQFAEHEQLYGEIEPNTYCPQSIIDLTQGCCTQDHSDFYFVARIITVNALKELHLLNERLLENYKYLLTI